MVKVGERYKSLMGINHGCSDSCCNFNCTIISIFTSFDHERVRIKRDDGVEYESHMSNFEFGEFELIEAKKSGFAKWISKQEI